MPLQKDQYKSKRSVLKINRAVNLVPIFDGKNEKLLPKFIKQCKAAERVVDPREHENWTFCIRNIKIVGIADSFLLNEEEPQTIDHLVKLLIKAFPEVYDINYIQNEFYSLKQLNNEKIRFFGARTKKLLLRATEAIKIRPKLGNSIHFFRDLALYSFINGLRDIKLRQSLKPENIKELDKAIEIAEKSVNLELKKHVKFCS